MCVCAHPAFSLCTSAKQQTFRHNHLCSINEMVFRMFLSSFACMPFIEANIFYCAGVDFFLFLPNISVSFVYCVFCVFIAVLTALLHFLTATISILNSISFQCRQLLLHFIFCTTKLRAELKAYKSFCFFFSAICFMCIHLKC